MPAPGIVHHVDAGIFHQAFTDARHQCFPLLVEILITVGCQRNAEIFTVFTLQQGLCPAHDVVGQKLGRIDRRCDSHFRFRLIDLYIVAITQSFHGLLVVRQTDDMRYVGVGMSTDSDEQRYDDDFVVTFRVEFLHTRGDRRLGVLHERRLDAGDVRISEDSIAHGIFEIDKHVAPGFLFGTMVREQHADLRLRFGDCRGLL